MPNGNQRRSRDFVNGLTQGALLLPTLFNPHAVAMGFQSPIWSAPNPLDIARKKKNV